MRIVILFFAAGTALCQLLAELPSWHVLPVPVLLTASLAMATTPAHPRRARTCVCVAALLTGFGLAVWRAEIRLSERLPQSLERQDIVLQGRIVDLPQRNDRGIRFQFEPEASASNPGVPGRISLGWYADSRSVLPALHSGERWQLRVRLRQPHGNFNPPGFDQEAWLFERGVSAQGYVRASPGNQRLPGEGLSFLARVDQWRESVRSRFEQALPDSPWRGVLIALVVGDQAAIPETQWERFRVTGTTHLMSISGLHVTLIALIVGTLGGALWRRVPALMLRLPAQKAALPAGVLAAGFYVLIAGAGVPAVRTFCMLLVAALALLCGRNASPSRIMAAALLCVLVLDPWAVLSAGFWLSFGAVGALLLMDAGRRKRPSSGGRLYRLVADWLRAQWAVSLIALPLLLGLFQQFSLVSPLANAVAIPVVSALVTPLAMLFALLPLPALASLAAWVTGWLMKFLDLLAGLPLALWQQAAPPAWLVACCLLAAAFALLPRGLPARWTGLLAFIPLLGFTPVRPEQGGMTVNVLDVGQGLAVHVQTHRQDLLFDAGPRYGPEADAGARIIVPWLRSQGVARLDDLVISHADKDHAGGAASLLAALPVGRLRSSLGADDPLLKTRVPHRPCVAGDAWEADGVRFQVLHPAADFSGSENDRSCVLRVSAAAGSVLLTGDIGLRAEERLVAEDASRLAAELLIAPHHGSRTSSGEDFIRAVSARHVVFTPGYLSRFGHPAPEVVARYEASGARLYRSDHDGLVRFRFDLRGIQAERMRSAHLRYWHDRD